MKKLFLITLIVVFSSLIFASPLDIPKVAESLTYQGIYSQQLLDIGTGKIWASVSYIPLTPEIALKLWFDGHYFNLGSPSGLFVITSTSTSPVFEFSLKKIQFTGKDANGKMQTVDAKVGFLGLKTGTFIAPINIPYDGLNITTGASSIILYAYADPFYHLNTTRYFVTFLTRSSQASWTILTNSFAFKRLLQIVSIYHQ